MEHRDHDNLIEAERQERMDGVDMGGELFNLVTDYFKKQMELKPISALSFSVSIACLVSALSRNAALNAYELREYQISYMRSIVEEINSGFDHEIGILLAKDN